MLNPSRRLWRLKVMLLGPHRGPRSRGSTSSLSWSVCVTDAKAVSGVASPSREAEGPTSGLLLLLLWFLILGFIQQGGCSWDGVN